MQIILLSGGSGQRLWPLSNDTRSKQFLRLLPGTNGIDESMVQRMARQIRSAWPDARITVATGNAQRDAITNQLGSEVEIVTEPSRRDTFPAIALASMWLAKEKRVALDEVVVVIPCDTFTDASYFGVIGKMASAIESGDTELALMGIEPSWPSTEFGYIICDAEARDRVARFCEKPSQDEARALIAQGALWNGGAFAFRLGFVTALASQYIKADDFGSIIAAYDKFPKISFDYEVVEKTSSVAVVRHGGAWKDLGTWDALAREMSSSTVGNAITEATANTTVINELNLPMVCYGLRDVIVAASPDGILVTDKYHSGEIKPLIDQLHARPMYEERRWGDYQVLDNRSYDDGFCALTKRLTLNPGCSISYQRHNHRAEIWTFVDGEGTIVLDGQVRKVGRGDVINIAIGQMHALRATTSLTFIEVQMGTDLIEEDIERFPWDWTGIAQ